MGARAIECNHAQALVQGWTLPSALLGVVACASIANADERNVEQLAERLAARWAPVYVQHVDGDDDGRDRPTRIDFDGNWDATDNWDNQPRFGTALPPAAYGAAILTATHAYLTYTLYYPRDWTWMCVPLVCHDNDLETVQLVVERDDRDGRLVEVRTKAHHSITDTPASEIASTEGHPVLRVEKRGHGIATCRPGDPACEPREGRIIYKPARSASSPPRDANGQTVHYELLSLRDTLWSRRSRMYRRLWTDGETGPLYYHGKYRGRLGMVMGAAMATSRYVGGVRPPWALTGSIGKRGDWFLDPAGARSNSEAYVYNPFLEDLATECRGPSCEPAPPERSRVAYFAKLGAPYVVLLLGAVAVTGLWRSRGVTLRF